MGNFRLKVFRAVARHLNFRRAAEELCLTQPAVTLQIKALEQELGVQLFDRSGAHITLTPAGNMLLKYAGKIEKLEAAALAALAQFSEGQRGELRIGASLTIAQYILPHLLGAFQQQHPQVRPCVTTCNTEQVLEALVAHEVSVGFIEGPTMRRDVRTEVFLEDEIVLMVPPAHEWSERGFIDPEELMHERLLMRERGSGTRRVVEMALQKARRQSEAPQSGNGIRLHRRHYHRRGSGPGDWICLALGDQQRAASGLAASRAHPRNSDQTAAQCCPPPWPGTPGDCPCLLQFPAIPPPDAKPTTPKNLIPCPTVTG